MFIFVTLLTLIPASIVIISYFTGPLDTFPILLLLLRIYDSRVEAEDLSRIEHKLDCLFRTDDDKHSRGETYERIHRTAWDHEPPIQLDQETVELGKKRSDLISVVGLFNGAVFYLFSAVWMYSILAGH